MYNVLSISAVSYPSDLYSLLSGSRYLYVMTSASKRHGTEFETQPPISL